MKLIVGNILNQDKYIMQKYYLRKKYLSMPVIFQLPTTFKDPGYSQEILKSIM